MADAQSEVQSRFGVVGASAAETREQTSARANRPQAVSLATPGAAPQQRARQSNPAFPAGAEQRLAWHRQHIRKTADTHRQGTCGDEHDVRFGQSIAYRRAGGGAYSSPSMGRGDGRAPRARVGSGPLPTEHLHFDSASKTHASSFGFGSCFLRRLPVVAPASSRPSPPACSLPSPSPSRSSSL